MPKLRRVRGELVFPADAGPAVAERVLVELRDVSWMDRPSRVLAGTVLRQVAAGPRVRLPFDFEAPEGHAGDALSLRAQVDLQGSARPGGDYLTTASQPVPATGDVRDLVAPLTKA